MAGVSGGFGTGTADGVEYDHRGHEGRQLRIAGHRELVGVGVEQEVGDVAAGRVGCLLDELPRGVVDPGGAHARRLGPLTRVGEDDHEILPSSSRSPEGQGRRKRSDPAGLPSVSLPASNFDRSFAAKSGAGFRDCRAGASCRGRPRGGGSRPRATPGSQRRSQGAQGAAIGCWRTWRRGYAAAQTSSPRLGWRTRPGGGIGRHGGLKIRCS